MGIVSSCATVGPATRTKTAMAAAIHMLNFDMICTPRATPDIAEARYPMASTPMTVSMTPRPGSAIIPVARKPSAIWEAPRPSDIAVPKTVAKMASTSMSLPNQPRARRSPMSGVHAAEMSCGRPMRNVE